MCYFYLAWDVFCIVCCVYSCASLLMWTERKSGASGCSLALELWLSTYEETFLCLTKYEDWGKGSSQEDAKKSRKFMLFEDCSVSLQLIGFTVWELDDTSFLLVYPGNLVLDFQKEGMEVFSKIQIIES